MGGCCSIMCKKLLCMDESLYSIEHMKHNFPIINDEKTLRRYITHAIENNHMKHIEKYLAKNKYIKTESDCVTGKSETVLTTGTKPLNMFARYASHAIKNSVDQTIIEKYMTDWMVCHNKPANDMNWNIKHKFSAMCGPDNKGPGHVFITTKDLDWKKFNVLTIILSKNVDFLLKLKEVANEYVEQRGWKKAGMYFHCFPHNNANSLYLNIVNEDKRYIGHMYHECKYKNLPLDVAIKVAQEL